MSSEPSPGSLRVDRSSTTDRAASMLRRSLFDGVFAPGTPLREMDLSQRLGVSRGTLREALRVLESEGLLSRQPHRGVVVKSLTPADLADLYQARLVIETGAVGARRGGPPGPGSLAPLRIALERYGEALGATDEQAVTDAHIAFHIELAALSGNRRLSQATGMLLTEMRLALAAADRRQHDSAQQLAAHHLLIEAVTHPDPAIGMAAVAEHLRGGLELLADASTTRPGFDRPSSLS